MLGWMHRTLEFIEILFAKLSLLLLLGLTLAQIVSRNLFDIGIPAADHLTRYLLLYITFVGAAIATAHDRHIRVDVIAHCLASAWQRRLEYPLRLISAAICLFFAHAAYQFWIDEWEYAAPHEVWFVLLNLILPIGFALLALHFLIGRRPDIPASRRSAS